MIIVYFHGNDHIIVVDAQTPPNVGETVLVDHPSPAWSPGIVKPWKVVSRHLSIQRAHLAGIGANTQRWTVHIDPLEPLEPTSAQSPTPEERFDAATARWAIAEAQARGEAPGSWEDVKRVLKLSS